jgi:hypothetical protein
MVDDAPAVGTEILAGVVANGGVGLERGRTDRRLVQPGPRTATGEEDDEDEETKTHSDTLP